MNVSLFLLFLVTSATTVATPGPGVLMTIMKSIRHGLKGAIWVILGTASGTVIMGVISATGLGLLIAASPLAYSVLQFLGGLYMIYLGIKLWRTVPVAFKVAFKHSEKEDKLGTDEEIKHFPFFMEGITLQMTNPMLIMFFISLFPQFIDQSLNMAFQVAVMLLCYFLWVVVIHTGYSIVVSHFRELLQTNKAATIINRIGGSLFMLLGLRVIVSNLLS